MKRIALLLTFSSLSVGALALPTLQYLGTGKGKNTKISLNGGATFNSYFAGEMRMKLTTSAGQSTFHGYCTDSDITVSGSPWGVVISNTNSLSPNGARTAFILNRIAPLIRTAGTNDEARALQLVIWELQEESEDTFDLTTGRFQAKETNNNFLGSPTLTAANNYLSMFGSDVAKFYISARNDSGAQFSQNILCPVPEPASLGVLGLGMIGVLRRKKKK